jgi:hypothetical protein
MEMIRKKKKATRKAIFSPLFQGRNGGVVPVVAGSDLVVLRGLMKVVPVTDMAVVL